MREKRKTAGFAPRRCELCGRTYIPSGARQRYCPECGKERARARSREYGRSHREELKAYYREYRRGHREEISARNREYYRTHKDEINAHNREYYRAHRDKITAWQREYYRAHRDEIREYYDWYFRKGGCVDVMMRRNAEDAKKAMEPGGFGMDCGETSRLADEKPEGCGFDGPCLECPYPKCVDE